MPSVALDDSGAPTVTLPDSGPPESLVVQPLVRGVGNQVKAGQTVIVQYTAVAWSSGEVIDSSWPEGRAPFTTIVGDSRPVAAWDEGLIEQTVGSQVLVVAPPAWAYGGTDSAWAEETVVFVVDILYAGTLAAPEDTGTQESDEGTGSDEQPAEDE
nr:FKBP-type peptidyl-prolyl cis-trans isomerase [Sanguibacter hominis]